MHKLIVIESPWSGMKGGVSKAELYLRNCIRDVLTRDGELPWSSCAMLAQTRALYEEDDEQREEGLMINRAMIMRADVVAFYMDHGMTKGMDRAKRWADQFKVRTEFRYIHRVSAPPRPVVQLRRFIG